MRFMGTIVPGRVLITTAPADRAIHPADQRRAIGASIAQVTEVIVLGTRSLMLG
jgi:hypothetical protein